MTPHEFDPFERQIFVGLRETETPSDLKDGERVELIRLGGPRDGDRIGYAIVEKRQDGGITLHVVPE